MLMRYVLLYNCYINFASHKTDSTRTSSLRPLRVPSASINSLHRRRFTAAEEVTDDPILRSAAGS